jgi:Domain of unknown function (DUF5666)
MTRLTWNMLAWFLTVSVLSTPSAAKDTPGKGNSGISFIQLGHISRIDAKNHSVMLSVIKDEKNDQAASPPRAGSFGRGGRFGRFGTPTAEDAARQMQRTYETKVIVNSETIFRDREGSLHFNDLKVGDFVEVEGVMHRGDFQAKQLRRHSKKADLPKIP